ncbi:nitrate- and nitrite sensing domain-containing protein, partial [Streptomyces sp. URMC 123]|uniref:sensor histidine kinase n=1 Tax=Streptomyces sp. URMC 123 TaxID=3423403 RepID=UPI003F1CEE80
PAPAPSGSKLAPRNWRVRTRLNAILLIPVLVALVFGGLGVKKSVDTWTEAKDAADTARLVRSAATYAHAVIDERDLSAKPLLENRRDDPAVQKARDATDAARADFDKHVKNMPDTPSLQRRLKLVREGEQTLAKLRDSAYSPALDGAKTEDGYGAIQRPLMAFTNELGLGTGNVTSYGRMVYAVSLAKAAASLQRSLGTHLLVDPGSAKNREVLLTAFSSYNFLEYVAVGEYESGGTEEDTKRLRGALSADPKVAEMAKMYTAIATPGTTNAQLKAKGITDETWMTAATAKFDAYRTVEEHLADHAVEEADTVAGDAQQEAIISSTIMVLALLAAFVIAAMMARSMSHSMRRLRNAAFEVAEQRLPALVDQLSRTDPGRVDTRIALIPITTKDEIGEVARAFDQVHREAVRLAAEQALLRGNVNAIFTNLSRRNQGLIERQLELITDLENNEADPDQLENLFRMDHLATRMRRNGENLLILAGEEPGRRWNQPVPLVDVIRAATSEVESYERIEISGVPESDIHGQAVTDLVHLLSELLENATTFSSPQTKVRVTATRLPDGRIMVEIHDKGIGLTAEDFADINHKLANPPTVDVAISQRMGLFVVGRLADRHGIRVQLRPSGEQAGTTSLVMLPEAITHGGGGDELPEDDFTVSRIVPEHEQDQQHGQHGGQDLPTAAELGFDESRYGDAHGGPGGEPRTPGAGQHLDPLGRSLLREERRAALEAQAAEQRPRFPGQDFSAPQDFSGQRDFPGQQDFSAQQGFAAQQGAGQGYEPGPLDGSGHPAPGYAGTEGWAQGGHPANDYPANPYPEGSYDGPTALGEQSYTGYETQPQQDDWPQNPSYDGGYQQPSGAESESPSGPERAPEGVGFDRPGPAPATAEGAAASNGSSPLTGAGLPRREKQWPAEEPGLPQEGSGTAEPTPDAGSAEGDDGSEWRSANDERWQRAGKLREPAAGGVTASGLPRRVPKANLVEGTAEQTPQGGPQVSRAPEDVRGRLSNLRRGVQQGRNAGTDTNGQATSEQHGGAGSTYDQER